ncbi:hypothetical protein E8E13_007589 [Curvularia kusanoi]|uniref:Glycoside hydrolase family 71 protein n=1 Tax=Curvularia kusanoi TaxID=90978 RepID=A0A9P4TL14_CURKU|nr:hypothetical protein E8E13_007589 [Curvularia kusanoi]
MKITPTVIVGFLAALGSGLAVRPRVVKNKPVFAHYMIGQINPEHTRQDIDDAQKLKIDAFALNFDQFADWSTNTVKDLFAYADTVGFGLFFSFDHNGALDTPDKYESFLAEYVKKKSYFKLNGRPLVSTFGGDKVTDSQWKRLKDVVNPAGAGDILIVPGFFENVTPDDVFSNRKNIDGVFNWNSWQPTGEGKKQVSMVQDKAFLSKAHSANPSKLFMMGISPLQFKNMNANNNWYRRGEDNLEYRLGQALELQPDMLQFQSWNDAGESHYMGNIWPEPMSTSKAIQELVKDRPHKAYWPIMKAFITAWKNGDTTTANMVPAGSKPVEGAFWHHTLTVDAKCGTTEQPKSNDIKIAAEDAVSGILLVAKGKKNLVAVVNVNGNKLDQKNLKEGYNSFKFIGPNFKPGQVQLEVWDGSEMVGSGYGKIAVTDVATVCNYNFQVVAVSS